MEKAGEESNSLGLVAKFRLVTTQKVSAGFREAARTLVAFAERLAVFLETKKHRSIVAEELSEMLESSSEDLTIVDCREHEDYRRGHIPGAVNLPYYDFRYGFDLVPVKSRTVAVCYYGFYSPAPAQMMARSKYPSVYSLDGGMELWIKKGMAVELGDGVQITLPEDPKLNGQGDLGFSYDSSDMPIYLDNHATTQVDPRVLSEMMPYLQAQFGNSSSKSHKYGWEATRAVRRAKAQVAQLIGAHAEEIIITSGATESNNLAIQGIAQAYRNESKHVITCATEHKAVLDTCRRLEELGTRLTVLPVDSIGLISLEQLEDAFAGDTVLVSIMAVNNEIGVIQPIEQIAQVCQRKGVPFHSDASQAIGKVELDVSCQGVDLLSISAHKIYGPKGIGALYVSKRAQEKLVPQIIGGGQERGLRSGTLNVPGLVRLGKACELMVKEGAEDNARIERLRNRLEQKLLTELDDIVVNGSDANRVSMNLHVGIAGANAESLMLELDKVAISSGSACSAASHGPSHVVRALGLEEKYLNCTLRFGVGRFNTEEQVDKVAEQVIKEVLSQRRAKTKA